MQDPILPAIDPAKVRPGALRARLRSSKFAAAACVGILVVGTLGILLPDGCDEGDACLSPYALVVPVMFVAFFGLLWSANRWFTTRRALTEQERVSERE